MKARESGMPPEDLWQQFFDAEEILATLGLTPEARDVVDFGCGFGTFAIPAARIVAGTVHALDIDSDMVAETKRKAQVAGLTNLDVRKCDFMNEGTGLPDRCVGYAMLFNILHAEEPLQLLREARRVLRHDGLLGIIHWNYDPATPRGPSMAIRPRPEECAAWAEAAGFARLHRDPMPVSAYHYGWIMGRKGSIAGIHPA